MSAIVKTKSRLLTEAALLTHKTKKQPSLIHFLLQRGYLFLQVIDQRSQLVHVPPLLQVGAGNDHLRLPYFYYIIGFDLVGLVHGVIADQGQPGF